MKKLSTKNYLKNAFIKMLSCFSAMALVLGITTTNSICFWWFHQPEEPKEYLKYRK